MPCPGQWLHTGAVVAAVMLVVAVHPAATAAIAIFLPSTIPLPAPETAPRGYASFVPSLPTPCISLQARNASVFQTHLH